uniref:Uncharacterized protein n=1 Tax=Oryza brachyantha TaxID=4533 RepID=J3L6Z7_ORYBR
MASDDDKKFTGLSTEQPRCSRTSASSLLFKVLLARVGTPVFIELEPLPFKKIRALIQRSLVSIDHSFGLTETQPHFLSFHTQNGQILLLAAVHVSAINLFQTHRVVYASRPLQTTVHSEFNV